MALNKVWVNVNEASYLKGTAGTTNTSPLDNQKTDMIHRPMCSVSLCVSLMNTYTQKIKSHKVTKA